MVTVKNWRTHTSTTTNANVLKSYCIDSSLLTSDYFLIRLLFLSAPGYFLTHHVCVLDIQFAHKLLQKGLLMLIYVLILFTKILHC